MAENAEKKPIELMLMLSDILDVNVLWNGKKVGHLKDLVVMDGEKVAEVTHLVVSRPFGHPALLVPWSKVSSIDGKSVVINLEDLVPYQTEPSESAILIRDHILDKKVLDLEEAEVEIVYDLLLAIRNSKLYVISVDSDKNARMKRMGIKWPSRSKDGEIEDSVIPWSYVQPLPSDLGSFKGNVKLKVLREKLHEIKPIDLADLIEDMDQSQRVAVFNQLDTETASDTLEEIDPNVQRQLIPELGRERVAELINQMTPGQAADVLSALPFDQKSVIMELLDKEKLTKIKAILERQDENVLHYITSKYIVVPPGKTAEEVQNEYPKLAKGKDVVMYLYVTEETGQLIGIIDIKELLEASDTATMADIMVTDIKALGKDQNLGDASQIFNRYDFRAIPVLDDDEHLIGVLPYRDVMKLTHHFVE